MNAPAHSFLQGLDEGRDRIPANIEAEQALLGAVLFDNAAYERLPDALRAGHFYEPFHQRLFEGAVELISKGRLAEPIVLMERFRQDPAFLELGGLRYLADLADRAPPAANAADYGRLVLDLAVRRRLDAIGREISAAALSDQATAAVDQIAEAERGLADLASEGPSSSAWTGAGTITADALRMAQERKGLVGLSTGLADLDDAMGGLRKGQLIIVAGRPAMGKSTAALQLAKAVARRGRGALFFSMEMPDFDLGLRLACDVAHEPLATRYLGLSDNPSYFDAARGRLNAQQWNKLDAAQEDISAWPLDIDTRAGLTVATMLAAARRRFQDWKRAGIEPGVVIVDHLTIARAEKERQGNKVAEVGDISRGLAEMAKSLDIPVVALCQLSRDVEKREKDKRPTLADLRWSGEIEQDARVVMFLYRPEYYLRKPEDQQDPVADAEYRSNLDKCRHKLFWLIEKNNNGPTGQVETYCDIACSAIRDALGAR